MEEYLPRNKATIFGAQATVFLALGSIVSMSCPYDMSDGTVAMWSVVLYELLARPSQKKL
eukprot:1650258-Amphidinium_carterae.1